MSTLGNIIWFFLLGWWQGLICALSGVIFCITIIGIPIGKSMFQYAYLIMFPFGKQIVRETFIKGKENVSVVRRVGGIIANVLWFPFGLILMLASIVEILACFISIIFIPAGIVLARSCVFLLCPIGAKVITKDEYRAILYANEAKRRNVYNNNNGINVGYQNNQINQNPGYNNQYPNNQYQNNQYQNNYANGYQMNNNGYQANNYQTAGMGSFNQQTNVHPPMGRQIPSNNEYCVYCGSPMSKNENFCVRCGRKAER